MCAAAVIRPRLAGGIGQRARGGSEDGDGANGEGAGGGEKEADFENAGTDTDGVRQHGALR